MKWRLGNFIPAESVFLIRPRHDRCEPPNLPGLEFEYEKNSRRGAIFHCSCPFFFSFFFLSCFVSGLYIVQQGGYRKATDVMRKQNA